MQYDSTTIRRQIRKSVRRRVFAASTIRTVGEVKRCGFIPVNPECFNSLFLPFNISIVIQIHAANKQGKNGTCTASGAGGSLWRPFGSVWRFRPRKSSPRSLYLCPQATGRTTGLLLRRVNGSPAIRLRTDFYVRRNIARCVSSYSILFGLLPKTLPLQGAGLSLRSRAALISNLRLVGVWWLMSRNH